MGFDRLLLLLVDCRESLGMGPVMQRGGKERSGVEEDSGGVSIEPLRVRLRVGGAGRPDGLAVVLVVDLAVVVVLAEPAADAELVVRGDGDVAAVEEAVDVGAEEEAVLEGVAGRVLAEGDDVGSVEGGK